MSLIALQDQLYLDLKIDSKDFPAMTNFMDEVAIVENVGSLVPTFSMVVNDSEDVFMDSLSLTDGNKFSMILGKDISEVSGDDANKSKNFRLFSYKARRYQTGYKYHISGIYDAPKFTVESKQQCLTGSTNTVLGILAKEAGLDYEGTATVDSQEWYNVSDTGSVFARKIAQHSFTPNGLMLLCLSSNNILYYKNVIDILNQAPKHSFSSVEESKQSTSFDGKTFVLADWEIGSTAGFMNHWLNYGYVLNEHLLDGSDKKHDSISLATSGNFVAINADVSENIEQARADYALIDCGNTHPNYWLGFHANLRRIGMFTQRIIVIVNQVTNLNILETADVSIYNSLTGKPSPICGTYLVTAKKTIIKGTRYSEIFELLKPSVTNAGGTNLVG